MKRLSLVVFFTLLAGLCHASEFRTFTDTQGREMQAKVTRVSGDEVHIQRRDGLTTKVKISLFSSIDQSYIREWETKNLLKSGAIEMRFSEEKGPESERSEGGIRIVEFEGGYEIILSNKSDKDVSDLRVEYLMILFADKLGAKKRSEGKILRQKGSIDVPKLASRSESRLPTKTFKMHETELEPGYVWDLQEAGHDSESKDKLEGIWVKVYSGDMLVMEDARPENMMRKEPW